jgi:hypothetical protein
VLVVARAREQAALIAEADDRKALSRGIQGLCIRIARAVNRVLQRTGRLFADRYHVRALTSPRAVKFAVRYVLLNARKQRSGALQPQRAESGCHSLRSPGQRLAQSVDKQGPRLGGAPLEQPPYP